MPPEERVAAAPATPDQLPELHPDRVTELLAQMERFGLGASPNDVVGPLPPFKDALAAVAALGRTDRSELQSSAADFIRAAAAQDSRGIETAIGEAINVLPRGCITARLRCDLATLSLEADDIAGSRLTYDAAIVDALSDGDPDLALQVAAESIRTSLVMGDSDAIAEMRQIANDFRRVARDPESLRRLDIVEGMLAFARSDFHQAEELLVHAVHHDPAGPVDGYLSHQVHVVCARALRMGGRVTAAKELLDDYEHGLRVAEAFSTGDERRIADLKVRRATALIEHALYDDARDHLTDASKDRLEGALALLGEAAASRDPVGRTVEIARAQLYLRIPGHALSGQQDGQPTIDFQAFSTLSEAIVHLRPEEKQAHDQPLPPLPNVRERMRLRAAIYTLSTEASLMPGISPDLRDQLVFRKVANERVMNTVNEHLKKQGRALKHYVLESQRMLIGLGREVSSSLGR